MIASTLTGYPQHWAQAELQEDGASSEGCPAGAEVVSVWTVTGDPGAPVASNAGVTVWFTG